MITSNENLTSKNHTQMSPHYSVQGKGLTGYKITIDNHNQLQMILQEKDNYIDRLNTELNELRVENERIKDKLILFELENLEKQTQNMNQA